MKKVETRNVTTNASSFSFFYYVTSATSTIMQRGPNQEDGLENKVFKALDWVRFAVHIGMEEITHTRKNTTNCADTQLTNFDIYIMIILL